MQQYSDKSNRIEKNKLKNKFCTKTALFVEIKTRNNFQKKVFSKNRQDYLQILLSCFMKLTSFIDINKKVNNLKNQIKQNKCIKVFEINTTTFKSVNSRRSMEYCFIFFIYNL